MIKGILSIDLRKSNGTHLAMAVPGIKQTNRDNVKSRMSLPRIVKPMTRTLTGKARGVGGVWIVNAGTKLPKRPQSAMRECVFGSGACAARCAIAMREFMYQSRQHGPSADPEGTGSDGAFRGKTGGPGRYAEVVKRGMKIDPQVAVGKQRREGTGAGSDTSKVDVGRRYISGDPYRALTSPSHRLATGVWKRDEPGMRADVIPEVDLNSHITPSLK